MGGQNGHNGKSGFYLGFIHWGGGERVMWYIVSILYIYFVFWDTYFEGNASYLCIAM